MTIKELFQKLEELPLSKKEDEYWVGVRFIGKYNQRKTAQCKEESWEEAFEAFHERFSWLCEIDVDHFILDECSLLMIVYEKD